jgi:hypothetical protein
MLRSLRIGWRSLVARRRLNILDLIAGSETANAGQGVANR